MKINDKAVYYQQISLVRSLKSLAKYFKQANKSIKLELDYFDICLCVLFDCYCLKFISGRETRHKAVSPPKFSNIS